MTRLVPEPDAPTAAALRAVLERAAAGRGEPAWAAVEDDGGAWQQAALAEPPATRWLAFLRTAGGAAAAARLGFAAAVRLPPATPAVEAALRAVQERPPVPAVEDDEVVALLPGPLAALAPAPLGIWRRLLGQRWVRARLAAVGRASGRPWVLLRGPLLVAATAPEDLRACWAASRLPVPAPLPVVHALEPSALQAGLDRLRAEARAAGAPPAGTVWSLPEGARRGAWRTAAAGGPDDLVLADDGWRIGGPSGGAIPECADADEVARLRAAGAVALRVPGFIAGGAGLHGTPGELAVDDLARAAAAAGLPLWLPQADHDAVRRLLALGVPAWVDGPGAPQG